MKKILQQCMANIRRYPALEKKIKDFISYSTDDKILSKLPQDLLDFIYFRIRMHLQNRFDWRRGAFRTNSLFQSFYHEISRYTSIEDKVICDLGCGRMNAVGLSTIFYLNGCKSTYAFDIKNIDSKRSATGLYEILLECHAAPENWLLSGFGREDYFNRLNTIDLDELKQGKMDRFFEKLPIGWDKKRLNDIEIEDESIDICFSQAVLEHLLSFDEAMAKLFQMMAPGGIMVHHVDFRDHRIIMEPQKYKWYSFLAEDEKWTDGLCNRLRPNQMKEIMEHVGFQVIEFVGERSELPRTFQSRLAFPFSKMAIDEIETMGGMFAVRKPGKSKRIY